MMRRRLFAPGVLPALASAVILTLRSAGASDAPARASTNRPLREVFVGGGIGSMAAADDGGANLGLGLNVLFYLGGRQLAATAQWLIGYSEPGEYEVAYSAISVGGRYRFLDADHTPFVGFGLAGSSVGYHEAGHDSPGNYGIAAFAELGVELFRLDSVRGVVALRVDQLMFEPHRDTNRRSAVDGSPLYDSVEASFTPISLNLTIGWAGKPAPWLMPDAN